MKRVYNHKISERANEQLRRRERTVQIQKQMFALTGIIIVSMLILLCSTINAFASSHSKEQLHKYYTSIQVQDGDTLWTLAEEYVIDDLMDREAFINEVSELNHLPEDYIHSGDYIVIPYYASELR